MSRTGESVDRDETVDDLCDGFFCPPFPPAPARPESHMSRGLVGPSRRAHDEQLRCSAPSQQLEHATYRGG
jgi:hypothetical protein